MPTDAARSEMTADSRPSPVNILTLKWGSRYGPHFVNRLYEGVRANLGRPFRFHCLTDDEAGLLSEIETRPLPRLDIPDRFARTAWLKLGLFADGDAGLSGDCLFLDLDILITGNMDGFFDYKEGKRCIIQNWVQAHQVFKRRPDIGNSSVFRWRANSMGFVLDKFYSECDWALANFHPPQTYLTYALGEKYWWPDSWVRSFKRHAVPLFPINLAMTPRLPKGTRILVFHGRPDPDQAKNGYRAKRLHRSTRPAPWIADY